MNDLGMYLAVLGTILILMGVALVGTLVLVVGIILALVQLYRLARYAHQLRNENRNASKEV